MATRHTAALPHATRDSRLVMPQTSEEGAEKQRHTIKQGMAGAAGWTGVFPFQSEKLVKNITEVFNSVGNMDKYLS